MRSSSCRLWHAGGEVDMLVRVEQMAAVAHRRVRLGRHTVSLHPLCRQLVQFFSINCAIALSAALTRIGLVGAVVSNGCVPS